ncbi:MAG: protein kinase, partial [Myxococcales bacterium]|nr:protein kinase [Myxococcales bacterium]
AMELLEGESLGERLERQKRLGAQETLRIAHDVAEALTAAHALGIVHRDLKPDNIFLVPQGGREIAKVLDFGIAKSSLDTEPGTATKTGTLMGTPFYMSPEQVRGAKGVDGRSDLWSLAVVIFECLTGERPFHGDALGALIFDIMSGELPNPHRIQPELPPRVDDWWRRAAALRPEDRYQDARALAAGLTEALTGARTSVATAADGSRLLGLQTTDPVPAAPRTEAKAAAPTLEPAAEKVAAAAPPPTSTFEGQATPMLPLERPRPSRMGLGIAAALLVLMPAALGAKAMAGGETPARASAAGWIPAIEVREDETPPPALTIEEPAAQPAIATATATPAAPPVQPRPAPKPASATAPPTTAQPAPKPAASQRITLSDPGY